MAVSANRLELLQIADAVAREKSIDRTIVVTAMEDAIAKAARSRYGEHLVYVEEHTAARARDFGGNIPVGLVGRRQVDQECRVFGLQSADPQRLAIWTYRPVDAGQGTEGALTPTEKRIARYLVNGLRDHFEMPGTPIRIMFRSQSAKNPFKDRKFHTPSRLRKHTEGGWKNKD